MRRDYKVSNMEMSWDSILQLPKSDDSIRNLFSAVVFVPKMILRIAEFQSFPSLSSRKSHFARAAPHIYIQIFAYTRGLIYVKLHAIELHIK